MTVNVVSNDKSGGDVKVTVFDQDGSKLDSSEGNADEPFTFTVKGVKKWWPESPNLYNITVTMDDDEVTSYTGFRTVSKGKVEGVMRYLLNDEFVFQFGTLDQGYWPDGLYTPPNYEAMVSDLKLLKELGFNMVRKHVRHPPDFLHLESNCSFFRFLPPFIVFFFFFFAPSSPASSPQSRVSTRYLPD